MLLKDKVALITGGGRGIGRAIAVCFAGEGASTVVTGRDRERLDDAAEEIRAGGGKAEARILDVTREDDAAAVVEEVIANWGRIDVLVNNSGVTNYNTQVWATTMEEWDEVMNTNLRGMHAMCRAATPHMMERQQGVIINIGSSAVGSPSADYGAYPASKWGVVGYTISLARSLRAHGIKVNGINPGGVDTDMGRTARPEGDPRWMSGDQVAQAALYLAAQAPAAMTGQFIDLFTR